MDAVELESSGSQINQSILDPGPAGDGWFDGFRGCYTGVAVVSEAARVCVSGACLRFWATAGLVSARGPSGTPPALPKTG